MPRGPAPKDPSVRARANKASTRTTLRPASGGTLVPELPEAGEDGWHPLTVAWWSDVWQSPMATEYVKADLHGLYMLATLIEQFWRHPGPTVAAEIRLQSQRFGLSPLDRRRLEWSIESAEESKDRGRQRRERQGTKQPTTGDDPRSALRAV